MTETQTKTLLLLELNAILGENDEFTPAQHLMMILRTRGAGKDVWDWSTNDLLVMVQQHKEDLNNLHENDNVNRK